MLAYDAKVFGRNNATCLHTSVTGNVVCPTRTVPTDQMWWTTTTMADRVLLQNSRRLVRATAHHATLANPTSTILPMRGAPATKHNLLSHVIYAMDLLYRCKTMRWVAST